jgi:hypothetical protein
LMLELSLAARKPVSVTGGAAVHVSSGRSGRDARSRPGRTFEPPADHRSAGAGIVPLGAVAATVACDAVHQQPSTASPCRNDDAVTSYRRVDAGVWSRRAARNTRDRHCGAGSP